MISLEVPRRPKAEMYAHGGKKKQFQFMLTEEASEKLDAMADDMSISRSEFLERLIRTADIDLVKAYSSENEEQAAG